MSIYIHCPCARRMLNCREDHISREKEESLIHLTRLSMPWHKKIPAPPLYLYPFYFVDSYELMILQIWTSVGAGILSAGIRI